MKKILTLAALLVTGIASSAHATILDVSLGTPDTYTLNAGSLVGNVTLPSAQLVTGVGSEITQGTNFPLNVQPTNITPTTNYLAVHTNGTATFTPNSTNVFGFTWGTIDAFNSLTITDASHTFTITGDDLALNLPGGVSFGNTEQDIRFTDPFGPILAATFTSTANAFEVANFFQGTSSSAVPLPGSAILFMTGLGALFMLRRKRII
jgi:hypothetical protein